MPDHSMPSRRPGASAGARRGRLLWAVLGGLVVVQLAAFWLVCSHQVRQAQMRDVSSQVQRVAVADCLRYIPHATLSSCMDRVDPGRRDRNAVVAAGDPPAATAARRAMSPAAPVSISYR